MCMFLRTVMALGLCAAPVCAQDWNLQPAALALSPPGTAERAQFNGGFGEFDPPSFGPLDYRQGGVLCLDLPGARSNCELAFRGRELMLIDRQSEGRIRVRIQFGLRP